MEVYCETYGCTMNKGDTEIIKGYLKREGHNIVDDLEKSELAIINTCAVKGTTMRRVIYRIRELDQRKNKKVIVAGCLPLIDLKRVEKAGSFEGIVSCLALDEINEVISMINKGRTNVQALEGNASKVNVPRIRENKVSAPIAISEGCLSNCSYCCVRFARGRLRSFKPESIITEIKNAVKSGNKEILLTSQDTAVYGMDGENVRLPSLLREITCIDNHFKIRVGMMNPGFANDILSELLEAFDNDKIYKFLHLPVQSGSNEVLNKMNRKYTTQDFLEITNSFRERFPDLYLATDVIVGFPGEDESDFHDTCELIKSVRPDKVNLSRFTSMPNTKASEMHQIKSEIKKKRSKKLSHICRGIGFEKNKFLIGRKLEGLVTEKGKKGGYVVRLPNYKPLIVNKADPGEFIKVKVEEAKPTYLIGSIEN